MCDLSSITGIHFSEHSVFLIKQKKSACASAKTEEKETSDINNSKFYLIRMFTVASVHLNVWVQIYSGFWRPAMGEGAGERGGWKSV